MKYDNNHIVKMWVLVLQVGITAIAPIVLCVVAGMLLKNYLEIDCMLVMVILGIVSGFVAAFRLAANQAGEDDEATKIITGMYDKRNAVYDQEEDDLDELLREEYESLNSRREDF